mgnify:CR=1 FL=1
MDSGSDSILVNASPDRCFAIATSFEDYPSWAKDVKQADVKDRDAQGRALIVDYRASEIGRAHV